MTSTQQPGERRPGAPILALSVIYGLLRVTLSVIIFSLQLHEVLHGVHGSPPPAGSSQTGESLTPTSSCTSFHEAMATSAFPVLTMQDCPFLDSISYNPFDHDRCTTSAYPKSICNTPHATPIIPNPTQPALRPIQLLQTKFRRVKRKKPWFA
jgi:hypothetical protein